jgi:chaperone modulatory protein CbpM
MHETDILSGTVLEDACLTLDELACIGAVSPEWIVHRIEEDVIRVAAGSSSAEWRFTSLTLRRVQRLRALERDFDAAPELAALVADLLEELDRLRRNTSSSRVV